MAVLKIKEFEHSEPNIGELQDEIKHRDRRIEELRADLDQERELVRKLRENAEEYYENIEQWCETFEMVMNEEGVWTWGPFWQKHKDLIDDYNRLVRDWNRFLPRINGGAGSQNVGRPLLASKAQCADVLKHIDLLARELRGIGGGDLRDSRALDRTD